MDALQAEISQSPGTCTSIVSLAGSLTARHVAILRRASAQVEGRSDCAHCILDMSDVDAIDGYGLAALVGMLGRWEKRGKMVLFGLRPDLRERFEATFCDALFCIRHDLATALAAVGEVTLDDAEKR